MVGVVCNRPAPSSGFVPGRQTIVTCMSKHHCLSISAETVSYSDDVSSDYILKGAASRVKSTAHRINMYREAKECKQ